MKDYKEPEVTFVVLDFEKPNETYNCLSSIKQRVKFPHKVIYYHNGKSKHAESLFRGELIDIIAQSSVNDGLGVGTRNAMALSFSPYTIYWQNDQILGKDFLQKDLDTLILFLDSFKDTKSIGLAGAPCGNGIYSERAHIIKTDFYRQMEFEIPLSDGGAGPYHHQQWREGQIQKFYRENNYVHFTDHGFQYAIDIGKWTIRDCAGGRIRMRTDTKAVWWDITPTESYIFPEHTESEWADAIAGKWIGGTIPQIYLDKKESFTCWDNLNL